MTELYSFGLNTTGQLGIGNDETVWGPQRIEFDRKVIKVSCGLHHTVILTDTGEVFSFGSNEYGSLGRTRKLMTPGVIEYLESKNIVDIACGDNHTLAVTSQGEVYAWGSNQYGQLGLKDTENRMKPSVIKDSLSGHKIVAVACGANHSVFLSSRAEVLVCGKGKDGQLGIGDPSYSDRKIPVLVESLRGIPIIDVVCGSDHSFFLTASGNVLSCGNNKFGQLGLNDNVSRNLPVLVESLLGRQIVGISAGSNHSFAVSSKGLVYSFGSNQFHQLPLQTQGQSQLLATIALDLMGSPIYKIAAGSRHSIAIRNSEENPENSVISPLITWGNGANGELGHGPDKKMLENPLALELFKGKRICDVACGGMHTIVVVRSNVNDLETRDFNTLPWRRHEVDRIEGTDVIEQKIEESKKFPHRRQKYLEVEEFIGRIFANPSSLNASFLSENHLSTSESISGLNLGMARDVYIRLLNLSDPSVLSALFNATLRLLPNLKMKNNHPIECLRTYLILFENPMLYPTTKQNVVLMEKIVSNVMHLTEGQKKILKNWIGNSSPESFLHILNIFESFLSYSIEVGIQSQQVSVVSIISMLYEINQEMNLVNYKKFYNSALSSKLDMEEEYSHWKSPTKAVFSYFRSPFLLNAEAKSLMLHFDARNEMGREQTRDFIGAILEGGEFNFNLVLSIDRQNLVQGTLDQLRKFKRNELKKPLKIEFVGEEGIDEGGLTKEFFQLIVRELFDKSFGAFVHEEESRNFWFDSAPKASNEQFFLAGTILGLGLYNSVLLECSLPLALYKKLLGIKPNLQDLKEVMPSIGRSLQKVLDYPGDVESDLSLTFSVDRHSKEGTKTVDLITNGSEIPVNNSNRRQYVKSMVEFYLETSVEEQSSNFLNGFKSVEGDSDLLKIFRPEELEIIICGNQEELNFKDLEKVAKYEGGFDANSVQVKWLWELLEEMEHNQKKQFLAFSTGSDRVPIGGLKSIVMTIQRNGRNEEQLPSASTCFNILLIPEYSSRNNMKQKLLYAIENGQGFGLQ